MPMFSWPLTTPLPSLPGTTPSNSFFAPGGGVSVPIPRYMTEADLLAVLDRVYPDWYLEPIKDPGPGYEAYQAFAKALERASLAIGRFEATSFILFSGGGNFATASVEFYRTSANAGAFTVKKGTICRASSSSRSFVLINDVEFSVSDLFVEAQVMSVAPGYEYNVPGPASAADGTVLPGDIDRVVIPILDPVYAEPNIQVRQISDAYGGQPAVLDQLGLDRNLPRQANETDEVYKERIRKLPDTVSIDAIRHQLDLVFLPNGLSYDLIETWENRYQSCWNAPIGGPIEQPFGELVEWAYNDPRTDRFIPRWMGERDHRAAFVLIVPDFPTFSDRGMAYNDPATEGEMSRGLSVWNGPVLDGPALSGVWNGDDTLGSNSRATFLHNVWDMLRQIKGGGVAVAFFVTETSEPL